MFYQKKDGSERYSQAVRLAAYTIRHSGEKKGRCQMVFFGIPFGYRKRMQPQVLSLLRQRQWLVVEQLWRQWLLLVCLVQLGAQRSELELQQRGRESAEQQQSVQRVCGPGGSAYTSDIPLFATYRLL